MEIDTKFRDMLVDELSSIAKAMRAEPDPSKKLFLFSAAFGMTNRVMRMEYDQELLLMDLVLNHTYNSFMTRMQSLAHGETVVPLTEQMMDSLSDMTGELANNLSKGKSPYPTLLRMNEIAFLTTGAGHYMRSSGKMERHRT